MSSVDNLPRLNLIDFYRLHGGEFFLLITTAVERLLEQFPDAELPDELTAIYGWRQLDVEIRNGGCVQYFNDHAGEPGTEELAQLLDQLELEEASELIWDVIGLIDDLEDDFEDADYEESSHGHCEEISALFDALAKMRDQIEESLEIWIRKHVDKYFSEETGERIQRNLTGTVVSHYKSGKIKETLEVKSGQANGVYREFSEAGEPLSYEIYFEGEKTDDYWPTGSLRKKVRVVDDLSVFEFYYPDGQIWKQLTKNDREEVVGEIKLYHQNGQLAEVVHFASDKRQGDWLQFFEDGTPKLIAEYTPDGTLLVHNYWDNQRKQIVKKGTGTFFKDDSVLTSSLEVVIRQPFPEEIEFRKYKYHGTVTRYFRGMAWSPEGDRGRIRKISSYRNGVQHGDETTYWENGQIKTRTVYKKGKVISSESAPKYDHPIPVILMDIIADETHYRVWDGPTVDTFPIAMNLESLQHEIPIPDFLQKIYEQNLNGIFDEHDFEHLGQFKERITYFLKINGSGEVYDVSSCAVGNKSVPIINSYPPYLKKLQFKPATHRGQSVESIALVGLTHTFAEASC